MLQRVISNNKDGIGEEWKVWKVIHKGKAAECERNKSGKLKVRGIIERWYGWEREEGRWINTFANTFISKKAASENSTAIATNTTRVYAFRDCLCDRKNIRCVCQ